MNMNPALFNQVASALDFIENNLSEKINLEDIARSACFSLFHFSRVFQSLTLISPYDYLIRRRTHEAAYKLINTDMKIIEIAFEFAFASPEVFNRAFKRVYQCQPNEYRKNCLFIPHLYRFRPEYMQVILQNIKTPLQIVKTDSQIYSIKPINIILNKDSYDFAKIHSFLLKDDTLYLLIKENDPMPLFWSAKAHDTDSIDNQFLYQIKNCSFLKCNFDGDALSLINTINYIEQIYTPRYSIYLDNLILFKRINHSYFELYFQIL